MIVEDYLVQCFACGNRDADEVAVRELNAFWQAGGAGGVHDGRQIVYMHRGDTFGKLLVGHRHAKSFQCAQGVAVDHEDLTQALAVVLDGIEAVITFAVVGDGKFDRGIVHDALGLGGGIGVVDRHVHRADGGQCEIEDAPFEAGGGEQRHRVAFGDAQRDQAFRGGDDGCMEFAGGDVLPAAGTELLRRDHRVRAGAFDTPGEEGVDGLIVVQFDGDAGGGVFGEHR